MAPKIKKYAPLLLIAALLPSAHLAWIARDMPHLGHIHDDAVYFVCAKSLAEGSGYRLLSFPGEPYQVKYPPLFPLLLSLVWRINPSFPDNLPLAMLLVWPLLPLYLVTARYLLLDLKIGETASWVLCAVMAVGPYVVFSSTTLLSELFFGGLLFACLALAQRAGAPESRTWLALAAGLLGGAAYLTRSAAIPLLVAVPLWFILRKQWKGAFVFAAAMLPAVVGWSLWVRAHTPVFADPALLWYGDYVTLYRTEVAWRDVPMLVWYNVRFLMNAIASHIFFQWDSTAWGVQILTVVSLLAIAGVLRLARQDGATPYHWFAAFSLPMMLAFHFPPTERYMMPFLPLLMAGAFVELRHLIRMVGAAWTKDRANRIVGGLIGAGFFLLACAAVHSVYQDLRVNLPSVIADYRQKLEVTIPAYDWVRRSVPPNGTFLAFRDPVLYLHTGHQGLRRPLLAMSAYRPERQSRAEQAGLAGQFARKVRLDYLLSTATDYDTDLIETDRELARKSLLADTGLERVFQSKEAIVYRVMGGASNPLPLAPTTPR